MFLERVSTEVIAVYRKWIPTDYYSRFSKLYREELRDLLGTEDAVTLVETAMTIGRYGDLKDHADMRKAVSRRLKKTGLRLQRGKRVTPGLERLVGDLVPLLLFFGLKPTSSEKSKLVKVLRIVAEQLQVPGDARDELRRRIRIEHKLDRIARQIVLEAAIRGLSPQLTENN